MHETGISVGHYWEVVTSTAMWRIGFFVGLIRSFVSNSCLGKSSNCYGMRLNRELRAYGKKCCWDIVAYLECV